MFKKIRKRDGRVVRFDSKKIADAIAKAGAATGEFDHKIARKLTLKVLNLAQQAIPHRIPTVEGIQDVVEEVLLSSPYRKTAKAYIIYREQHAGIREITAKADVDMVDQYLEKLDWQVNENSNMTFSLQGLNNYISSEISKTYWLIKIYPSEIRQAHLNGDFHIHDLNILSVYCVGWDLFDLLVVGFRGAPGKVESEPAKHFRSALGQVVNFFYSLQGEAAGAQAFSNFDTLLAPFIRADGLGYEEVKQALQEFVFNVNVPTRVGFQAPFTNITLDLVVPDYYANQSVAIGGVPQKETYKDFKDEIELFNRALLEVMAEGDAKGRVFTFPIPTYNITKDFDWANPNLDVLWQVTAKYGVPYFSNFINSDMNPEDARSMCPIGGNEKVLIKSNRGRGLEYSTIKYIYEGNAKGDVYEIYSDGKFVKGKFNKFPAQKMIKVTLENGHVLKMTEQHLNFVMLSPQSEIEELEGIELREGMYLPYSLKAYEGSGGNKDMGYFVGAFAGDGSFDGETSVVFSLSSENERKRELVRELIRIGKKYFGASYTTKSYEDNKLYTLKVHSRAAVGLCKDFVSGKERDTCYRARLFNTGKEFRKAVIEGHYATDGGNRNRIYTSSPKMVETLNMLAASLGTTTSVYMDNREGRLGTQPNYAVLIYQLNREKYGNIWFKHDNKLWVEIKSIESITDNTAYCFEVENGEPMFTVGTTGILTHNCRLRIDNRKLVRRGGALFGSSPLTGSIGVVTINMPRLGYSARDEEDFIMALERLMVLAKESLEIKRKVLENFMEKNLYPYTKYYLRGVKERFGEYWKNHFSTIGLVGMNEACLNMFGENIASEKSRAFTLRVLDFMRDKLLEFQEETGNNYNLEATPAEGTSYRLAKKDKESNPKIICANEDDWEKGAEPFYTNSTQLPVNYTDDVFEALDLQDEIQTKYTGGTVVHIFAGERVSDPNTLKALIRKICELYHLPYFTFTPTFCYDEKTEILTDDGWKRFSELGDEKVMTVDPETRELSYQQPLRKFVFPYQGTMTHFKSRTFDCMVTPEHRMFVAGKKIKTRDPKTGRFTRSTMVNYFVAAKDISAGDKVPMTGYKWKGEGRALFILPGAINNQTILTTEIRKLLDNHKTGAEISALCDCSQSLVSLIKGGERGIARNYPAMEIPINSWLKFFGIWLAEGSVRGSKGGDETHRCEVVITQKDKQVRDEIREMLKELPFKFSESPHGFYIYNKQLWAYLKQFGNSRTKYIPEELKALSPEMLQTLLEWYLKGDGTKGSNYCCSFSKRLRDDLQEIYLKIGFDASVSVSGLVTKRTHKCTYLKEIMHKEEYSGYVYCVEVPNHVVYVRRNGRPNFSGNSVCPTHGYIAGEHYACPTCGAETEVYSRVVGYLRPVNQWNRGKQEEFKKRKTFKV